MIVTIDGPNSVGKGTLASRLAEFYGYAYFDTGMVYRAVALLMILDNLDINDESLAEEIALDLTYSKMIELSKNPDFRGPECSNYSAIVASYPKVRQALLKMQQEFAFSDDVEGVIFDGRDTGTVVCPSANLKFFITASSEVRATRRYKYYQSKGIDITYEQVLEDVITRDDKDMNRAVSPLKAADDAIIIDTSNLSAYEAFEKACEYIDDFLSRS